MTNLLNETERQTLAEVAGLENKKHGAMPYWYDAEKDLYRFPHCMWLIDDLTSPESYYQVFALLLPAVRERGYFVTIGNVEGDKPQWGVSIHRKGHCLALVQDESCVIAIAKAILELEGGL